MSNESALKLEAQKLLNFEPGPETWVTLVSWLDLNTLKFRVSDPDSFLKQFLAHLVVAMGRHLNTEIGHLPTVAETIRLAQAYMAEPNEITYTAYRKAASRSYPFGPGDGYYHIAGAGYEPCQPGCGCISGAGCLVDSRFDSAKLMMAAAKDVSPWIRDS